MTAIVELIVAYSAIVGPAITAIFGVIFLIARGVYALKKSAKEISDTTIIKEVSTKLDRLSRENHELTKANRLLADKITRIEGYSDATLGELPEED